MDVVVVLVEASSNPHDRGSSSRKWMWLSSTTLNVAIVINVVALLIQLTALLLSSTYIPCL